jgi:uncharacterized protein (DUF1330 family)
MAKGYWVVFADVSDAEGYKEYIAANGEALAKYGARFLARGGKTEASRGKATLARHCLGVSQLRRGHRLLPLAGILGGNEA